ncbi:MAG: hypothetical protein WBX11_16830 [Thiobacillaceae bacterium]
MASTHTADPLKEPAKATRFLEATIAHEKDVAALASLDDAQLSAFVRKTVKAARRPQAAKLALNMAVTFRRIAAMLATQDSADMLTRAKEQATKARTKVVAEGAVISSGDIAKALGVSRQALSKAVQDRRLFFVEVGGDHYYPAFYADPEFERRQLGNVCKALGDLSGWQKWQFFTTAKASLGRLTPLEALRKGRYEPVLKAAAGFAER